MHRGEITSARRGTFKPFLGQMLLFCHRKLNETEMMAHDHKSQYLGLAPKLSQHLPLSL